MSELTAEEMARALTRTQRSRIAAGRLESGDVKALRRFIHLTMEQFAEALGVTVELVKAWEADHELPAGPSLALLRIAARSPGVIRRNLVDAA